MRKIIRGKLTRTETLRYASLVLGILAFAPPLGFIPQLFGDTMLCGQLCGRMAIGLSLPRELVSRTAGVGLLFLWLVVTFFFGRWFCGYLCPVGGLTEFASKLIPTRCKVDYCKHLDTPLFRYGFLGAFILLPALGVASICCAYCSWSVIPEVFGAIFVPRLRLALGTGTKLVSIFLYIGLLGMFARDGRGHCHLVCPVGALDSIAQYLGAKLPFARRMRVDPSRCSGCTLCEPSCPASAIRISARPISPDETTQPIAVIDYHRCYQCRSCERACHRGALGWGKNRMAREKGMEKIPSGAKSTGPIMDFAERTMEKRERG